MIECPACGTAAAELADGCPSCGFAVARIDGFEAWAPELARSGEGEFFQPHKFQELAALEDESFWFQARNELILWALGRHFGAAADIAEIGCGTGYVLGAVERALPEARLLGTELFVNGLKFAARRCRKARLVQVDARRLPFRAQFDVVGIFDVLEHIEEDELVLAQIHKALVPGGGLLVTVPQHRWLWSAVDEAACHVRRYSAAELRDKVEAAGFELLRSTSFVSLLLPAMFAARFAARRKAGGADAELRINRSVNRLFRQVMAAEFALIRRGIDFALGGSRLLIARKT